MYVKSKMKSCLEVALKNKMMVLGIILIPFLYAILYVNAFWNPVDRLENLEIAVINLDCGTEYHGEKVNYGETIQEKIAEDDSVQWKIEDKELLEKGIENTSYSMAFVIEKDFSEKVTAASDGEPQQGNITYFVDKRKNFVLSQYGNMIRTTFQNTVSQAISEEYTETIYGGLQDIAESLGTAADGTEQINNGSQSAADGTSQLRDGAETLAEGTEKLSDSLQAVKSKLPELGQGIGTLQTGVGKAQYGSSVLYDGLGSMNQKTALLLQVSGSLSAGLEEAQKLLPSMAEKLNATAESMDSLAAVASKAASAAASGQSAANHIDDALAALSSGDTEGAVALLQSAKGEAAAAGAAAEAMTTVSQTLTAISGEAKGMGGTVNDTAAKVGKMADGASSLYSGLGLLADGVSSLSDVSFALNDGLTSISDGVSVLSSSASALSDGSTALAKGAVALNDGAGRLAAGLTSLENGLFTLSEGTSVLHNELRDGAAELDEKTLADKEAMAEFIVAPVETAETSYGTAETYGMGFSPFFISLSCWLGAVLLFFVVPVRPAGAASTGRLQMVFGPMPVFGVISILQALAIGAGTLLIGVNVNNIALLFLMTTVMSLAFAFFIQFLNLTFGLPGRGFAVILLIFQLCACGGTFPVELINTLFAKISPYMPFTYTVKALKEIMFGADFNIILPNMVVIILLGLVSLLLSLLFYNKGMKHDKFAEIES